MKYSSHPLIYAIHKNTKCRIQLFDMETAIEPRRFSATFFMNDACNAFVPDEMIRVEHTTEGRLSSLTFAVKELYDVKGFITGAGNPRWKNTHQAAKTTAPVVERLLNEGATLIGKTISDEMAFSLDGENAHYGTPLNIKCPDRIPGGSSSGSAAAVGCGMVDFALGTDTAGSMRIPASYCGIYGIRTTHGAISLKNVHTMAPSFDAAGWFAKTPDVFARVGSVLLNMEIHELKVDKFLIVRDLFDAKDPVIASRYHTFIQRLSALPVKIVEMELGKPDFSTWIEVLRNIQWWELNQEHGAWIFSHLDAFGEEMRGRLEKISGVSQSEMEAAMKTKKNLRAWIESIIVPGVIAVFPTAPGIAPLKGRSVEGVRASRIETMKHTSIATVAGLPQVSMPLMEQNGCPLGISFMGAPGQDGQLLAAALAYSRRKI